MKIAELSPNQTVGLSEDAAFRGYFYGESYPTDPARGEVAIVYVKVAGASGLKQGAVVPLLADRLTRVRA